MDFEQSSTGSLSPGNGVVKSPGDEVITFQQKDVDEQAV